MFCDASGFGAGGVWLDPSRSGKDLIWRHPWPSDIISDLVSSTNREETINISNLELAVLVLHKFTLLATVPEARLDAPHSGSDNTLTVSLMHQGDLNDKSGHSGPSPPLRSPFMAFLP